MATFDKSSWDKGVWFGETASAYCAACLIDENTGSEKIKDKCHLPIRKPGNSSPNANAINAAVGGHGIGAVKASPEAKKKAANRLISLYQSLHGSPAPESVYRIAGKTRPKAKSYIKFYKNKENVWFLGFYSNNYMDLEGEILTKASHDEFATWVNKKGITPPITLFHLPHLPDEFHMAMFSMLETGLISTKTYNEAMEKIYSDFSIAKTITVVPLDGFNLVVGRVHNDKVSRVEKMISSPETWLMSHGFLSLEKDDNIISKYRSFEFSVLTEKLAANALTPTVFSGVKMSENISEEHREMLENIETGLADSLTEAVKKTREVLNGILSSKELQVGEENEEVEEAVGTEEEPVGAEESETEAVETEEKGLEYETLRQQLAEDFKLEELKTVLDSIPEVINTLGEQVKSMSAEIKELKRTDDEKIADTWDWGWNPVDTKGTNVETDEEDEPDLATELKQKSSAIKDEYDNLWEIGPFGAMA